MKPGASAIVVSSEHLFADSLPMASIGEKRFLEFLLGRIARAQPEARKIFSMAYLNVVELDQRLFDLVTANGFEMFVGDRDHAARLARVARRRSLEILTDIRVENPLTSLHYLDAMLESHVRNNADITLCHNLPRALSPIVVSASAASVCKSLSARGFVSHYGVEKAIAPAADYAGLMLANPAYFKINLFEAPIRWEGAGFDAFSEDLASLTLTDKAKLPRLREVIYTMGKEDITSDDVIDVVLIENMRKGWDKSDAFDTKYAVVDSHCMGDEAGFERQTLSELDEFVFDDPFFMAGEDPAGLTILELGCGHGRLVLPLAARFKEAHGADASRERCMEARYRLRGLANAHITQNDGRSLVQYPDNAFDRCFAHGVLVHINSKSIIENYISEMARVVKPGCPIKFDIYHGEDVFGIGARHFIGARYTEEEIAAVFARSGLGLVNIDYALNVEFSRAEETGREKSGLALKQMLVVGRKT